MPLFNLSDQDRHALTRTRLAAIVRSSADAIIGETLDGIITDWNPAAERLYGYTAEEAIGQHLSMLAPPEERAGVADRVARVRGGESIEGLEVVRWTKDGRRLDISLTVSPVYDDAGEIVATSAIVRDISAIKAHERALAASEERFRVAFDDAPIGITLTAPDTEVLHVNRAICAILGYSAAELLSTTFEQLTHPEDVAATRALVERALAGEITAYAQEKRYIRKDGQIIWVMLNGSLVRDETGAPRYFITQIQDITERKDAETALSATHSHTREVLERITDGFYAFDREWRFTYVNEAAERILGRTRTELLGNTIWEEFPQAVENPVYPSYQQAMAEGVTTTVEFFYPPLSGWYEARAYPSPNGLSVFFTDVTERNRLDQEVRTALEAAQAATRVTRQFLTMMSHELRTPTQAIMGYAELLLAGPKHSLTPEQVEDVQTIQRGASRLADLITQMLDLSRLDAGQTQLTTAAVDLATIVEQVRQGVAPQAAARNLALCIDLPAKLPRVLGDEMGVYQILLNLVGNAVKFTERGEVRISAECTDGEVAVAVRDTGIGISPEVLPHIFDEFRQVDRGMTRRYEGAGLGLTIARRLAERMGGRLTVESQPEVGSTFTLHLPAEGQPR